MQAYTVEQVAKMLHIGRDKVYELLRTGQLRSIKIGKLRRITDDHLAAFVAPSKTTPRKRSVQVSDVYVTNRYLVDDDNEQI